MMRLFATAGVLTGSGLREVYPVIEELGVEASADESRNDRIGREGSQCESASALVGISNKVPDQIFCRHSGLRLWRHRPFLLTNNYVYTVNVKV